MLELIGFMKGTVGTEGLKARAIRETEKDQRRKYKADVVVAVVCVAVVVITIVANPWQFWERGLLGIKADSWKKTSSRERPIHINSTSYYVLQAAPSFSMPKITIT